MSSLLYALGRFAYRAKFFVLGIWLVLLALIGAGGLFLSQGANAPVEIPGTESQEALDSLSRTFPEVSGSSAQIVVVAPDGVSVETAEYRAGIADATSSLEGVYGAAAVLSPTSQMPDGTVSENGRAALITLQLNPFDGVEADERTISGVIAETDALREALPADAQVSYGGQIFGTEIPHISATEAIGVVIAAIVLLFTLGSLIAAGMPLLIALLGVAFSVAGIYFYTAVGDITSITPMLALMLGLAVGIDYTLFIVARHQEQLKRGMDPAESAARANATSGSAVIFAGLTVIIALVGMSVAGIPFLTALGVAAAFAVFVSVLMAITLTPALLGLAGLKILPKKTRARLAEEAAARDAAHPGQLTRVSPGESGSSHPAAETTDTAGADRISAGNDAPTRVDRFFGGWVKAATKIPALTIVLVLLGLGVAALPAKDLQLALPDASGHAADSPARITYEQIGEHFGAGNNGPLLLTASIITSDDPLTLMEDLAAEVRAIPGVAEVPLATPNPNADTGIIQVVPATGPHDPATEELVNTLRDQHDRWEDEYGVSISVTGFAAVAIDISALLMGALLPFGALVVGLSLILLAMVFRSVWVPIKATLGYLLSVLVAFGAVVAVFQYGWLGDALNVHATGPVLSFMPIILMGVLFGLAMDYEVFLVARIREDYVHGGNAQRAIRTGFVGSAKVVTAAAIIMLSVFAAFIPAGDVSIKPIALGLAVGVFVDAFIVRMTLVPAVLAMLGEKAWWMPKWLDRLLPSFDVEGEGLAREMAHTAWPADAPDSRIASEGALMGSIQRPEPLADLRVSSGEALLLDPASPASLGVAEVLTGRAPLRGGIAKVAGFLLPERAGSVRARSAFVDLSAPDGPASLRQRLAERPSVLVLTGIDARCGSAARASARSALEGRQIEAANGMPEVTLILLATPTDAATVLPQGTKPVLALDTPASTKGVTL